MLRSATSESYLLPFMTSPQRWDLTDISNIHARKFYVSPFNKPPPPPPFLVFQWTPIVHPLPHHFIAWVTHKREISFYPQSCLHVHIVHPLSIQPPQHKLEVTYLILWGQHHLFYPASPIEVTCLLFSSTSTKLTYSKILCLLAGPESINFVYNAEVINCKREKYRKKKENRFLRLN